jgi:hypothetical protein
MLASFSLWAPALSTEGPASTRNAQNFLLLEPQRGALSQPRPTAWVDKPIPETQDSSPERARS